MHYRPGTPEHEEEKRQRKKREAQALRNLNAGTRPPAPVVYRRACNRCNRKYAGTGRLLCDRCRDQIEQYAPIAEGG